MVVFALNVVIVISSPGFTFKFCFMLAMPIVNATMYSREIYHTEWSFFFFFNIDWDLRSAMHFSPMKPNSASLLANPLRCTAGTSDNGWWKLMNGWYEVKKHLGINKYVLRSKSRRKRCLFLPGELKFSLASICFHKIYMKIKIFLVELVWSNRIQITHS